jgi:hypothetical protein
MSLRFLTFTFWNYYVLQVLRLETITFSDATLSDINVVLCYVLLQYRTAQFKFCMKKLLCSSKYKQEVSDFSLPYDGSAL